jgi:hypothetical protein
VQQSEVDGIGRCLTRVDAGRVFAFQQSKDVQANIPAGDVDLVVLTASRSLDAVERMLRWIRHRWPKSLILVLGEDGSDLLERKARQNGALFMPRPISDKLWKSVLDGAIQLRRAKFSSA